jgi:collagenase-like PrtC family protease
MPLGDGGRGITMILVDLCMLFHVDELKDAGVTSLKLEGRNEEAGVWPP